MADSRGGQDLTFDSAINATRVERLADGSMTLRGQAPAIGSATQTDLQDNAKPRRPA
jgi:hypothetical protein